LPFFYDCEGNLLSAYGGLECGGPAPFLDNDSAIVGYLASPGSAGRLTGFIDVECGGPAPFLIWYDTRNILQMLKASNGYSINVLEFKVPQALVAYGAASGG